MLQSDSPGHHQAAIKFIKAHSLVIFHVAPFTSKSPGFTAPPRRLAVSAGVWERGPVRQRDRFQRLHFHLASLEIQFPANEFFRISQHSLKTSSPAPLSVWRNAGFALAATLDAVLLLLTRRLFKEVSVRPPWPGGIKRCSALWPPAARWTARGEVFTPESCGTAPHLAPRRHRRKRRKMASGQQWLDTCRSLQLHQLLSCLTRFRLKKNKCFGLKKKCFICD